VGSGVREEKRREEKRRRRKLGELLWTKVLPDPFKKL